MSRLDRVGGPAFLVPACLLLAACGLGPATSTSVSASPTVQASASVLADTASPAAITTCTGKLTAAQTEGPYFKAGSSERASLLTAGMQGTRLVLSGKVTGTNCQPVARAMLDFWQADYSGNYDNSGYTLRGHVFTDAAGNYTIATIVPGLYTGRTEHIHVKVQAPGGPVVTTQLYFPGVTQNDSDGIFDAALLMRVSDGSNGKVAAYDFVVPL